MSRGYVYAAFGRGGRKSRRDRTIIIYDLELVMWKVSKNKRMGFDVEKRKKNFPRSSTYHYYPRESIYSDDFGTTEILSRRIYHRIDTVSQHCLHAPSSLHYYQNWIIFYSACLTAWWFSKAPAGRNRRNVSPPIALTFGKKIIVYRTSEFFVCSNNYCLMILTTTNINENRYHCCSILIAS